MNTPALQSVVTCFIQNEIHFLDSEGYLTDNIEDAKKFRSTWQAILYCNNAQIEWKGSGLKFKARYLVNGEILLVVNK